MSWPLASFTVIVGALALGWLAYERARPSARMIALVATLAALAALGRDAFVALPDVKPITAMTLVVGYALGPLAGFTVGALGMLSSNILLGQGAYTPWQMVAWGLVGIAGAVLGLVTRRRASRLTLAGACAISALAAKELMNVYAWTIGGAYTGAALLARVVEGLPFDVTDVVASFLFGLAFAPELARLLARVRARMEVHWMPVAGSDDTRSRGGSQAPGAGLGERATRGTAAALILVLALAALAAGAGRAGARSLLSARQARTDFGGELSYIRSAQNPDGGFGEARGRRSSELYSAWTAMALAAAGAEPLGVRRHGRSVLDSLRSEASTLEGVGDVERTILALHSCGVRARTLGSVPLEAKLFAARRPDGSFSEQVNLTSFAIFALRAEGRSPTDHVVEAAARWIAGQQDSDGGFGFATRSTGSEVDDTAAAVEAITTAGVHERAVIARALSYITRAQNPDGGFPEGPGTESNAQSTAWAVQGLVAAGRNVEALRRAGRSPLGYLRSLVAPDGSVRYSRTSAQTPVWVTAQALIALARKPFPVAPVRSLGASAANSAAGAPSRASASHSSGAPTPAPATGVRPAERASAVGVTAAAPLVSRSDAVALSAVFAALAQSITGVAQRALAPIGVASSQSARDG
jgi:energy-coupling factor transport system substrate-specific component